MKQGEDRHVMEEAFYFSLVQASIRVGHSDVVCEILQRAKEHKVCLSVQFFQSVLKLLASKMLFKERRKTFSLDGPRGPSPPGPPVGHLPVRPYSGGLEVGFCPFVLGSSRG